MTYVLGATFIVLGAVFFIVGTIGLLRFPDVHARLHAPTKADNVGLGLMVAGLALWHGWSAVSAKLVLIWLLVLPASGIGAYLIARDARRRGVSAGDQAPRDASGERPP